MRLLRNAPTKRKLMTIAMSASGAALALAVLAFLAYEWIVFREGSDGPGRGASFVLELPLSVAPPVSGKEAAYA